MDKNSIALKALEKNKEKNCCILENLIKDNCKVIYADENSAAILPLENKIPMIFADSHFTAEKVANIIDNYGVFFTTSEIFADIICKKYSLIKKECKQIIYLPCDLPLLNENVEIKQMDFNEKNVKFVADNYTLNYSIKEVEEIFKKRFMLAAYIKSEIAGFIGMHEERSVGLLEVLPEYRKQGLGAALIKYAVNAFYDKGFTPFSHVIATNNASLSLHTKLDCKILKDSVFWCVKDK